MLEVLRRSLCHRPLYRRTDTGVGRLPVVSRLDHNSYAYVFNQPAETVAPSTLQPETSGTSRHIVRTAGARAHTLQRGAFMDHYQYDLFQLALTIPIIIMQLLSYSTVLSRGAEMRRTGNRGPRRPMLCANVN